MAGRYCGNCGQRYREKKETFGDLVNEFIGSFTNFDSRFFRTVIPLLTRPGRATRLYMGGRQTSMLHPVRLYLFSSFIYFLCLFSCGSETRISHDRTGPDKTAVRDTSRDSWIIAPTNSETEKVSVVSDADSTFNLSISGVEGLDTMIRDSITPDMYIAMQDALPDDRRDGFFKRNLTVESLELYYKGKAEGVGLIGKIFNTVMHNIPKTLFILLPLFALLLKLLYIRRRQFNYVDHAVLSLHYFSLVFILLLLTEFVLDPLFNTVFFSNVAITWLVVYFFIAMKRIYGQGFGKTLAKYLLLAGMFSILLIAAFVINFLIGAFVA